MVRGLTISEGLRRLWEWKRVLGTMGVWYMGLVYFRDTLQMGEFYLLASGFWMVYMIGFSPRLPGELSAYSHFNENHQRIYGDLDPHRAGRELTGQSLFGDVDENSRNRFAIPEQPRDEGYTLGRGGPRTVNDEDDPDLQRALLISLREERETRRRTSKGSHKM